MHRASVRQDLIEKELTGSIIGAFYYVYNELGYGFLEKIYSEALCRTLNRLGHDVAREKLVPIYFEGGAIAIQRVDMLIDSRVVVEIKSTFEISEADRRQVTSYLTGSELQVGLLLHFGPQPKFYRFVHTRSPRKENPANQQLPP
jgi:GxxExxY protein